MLDTLWAANLRIGDRLRLLTEACRRGRRLIIGGVDIPFEKGLSVIQTAMFYAMLIDR